MEEEKKEESPKLEYQDLLYFGYSFGEDAEESERFEKEFKEEIETRFLNVKLKDAHDSIKGYRQEVYLEQKDSDEYYAWLIALGWFEFSLTMQLIMMSHEEPEQKEKFDKYFALAKEQYPEKFKK
jgi:hypothetical protein